MFQVDSTCFFWKSASYILFLTWDRVAINHIDEEVAEL